MDASTFNFLQSASAKTKIDFNDTTTQFCPNMRVDDLTESDLENYLSDETDDSSDNEDWDLRQDLKTGVKREIRPEDRAEVELKARTFVEEKMTKALIRKCWRCRQRFIKVDGCNALSCTCGAVTCYHCRQPVRKNNYPPHIFCPPMSLPDEDHLAVIAAEIRAKKKIEKVYPQLRFNHYSAL